MSDAEQMLAVQDVDLALDQLPHRSARLEERAAHQRAVAELDAARAALAAAQAAIAGATGRIEELEAEGAVRATKKARLDAQMKTVISSREVDALTHELAGLAQERSAADDEELELMDLVEQQTARETELTAEIVTLSERADATAAELAAAEDVLAGERAALSARRAEAIEQLGTAGAATYERLRKSYGGVAISRLHAGRCGACHLDQSRAALDALKHLPEGTWTECEQCGRLLVP